MCSEMGREMTNTASVPRVHYFTSVFINVDSPQARGFLGRGSRAPFLSASPLEGAHTDPVCAESENVGFDEQKTLKHLH